MLFVALIALSVGAAAYSIEARADDRELRAVEEKREDENRAARDEEARQAAAAAEATKVREAAEAQQAQDLQDAADALTKAKAAADARDLDMAQAETGGWTVVESGTLYYRYAEDTEVDCGSWDCTGVFVYTFDGCDSVYVEAAVESNGVVIGMANDLIGALLPGQSGGLFLEDFSDRGDTFRVTDVSCR
ncbi:hypothetical protein [Sanguibacter sp. 25GB23B1]|uniref:hypothetical protein n=1 Tax=unclassified Sanguibacter TaxID=2645534 RepID=UPI0032AFBC0B